MEHEAHGLLSMPGVGFFGMLIIGIIAGYIAEKVTASDQGLLTNLLVGIAGSFVGLRSLRFSTSTMRAGSAIFSSPPSAPFSSCGCGGDSGERPNRRLTEWCRCSPR